MMCTCDSLSRSPIDENNDIVNKSWIVHCHGMVVTLTSAAVFTTAEDLAYKYAQKFPNVAVKTFLHGPVMHCA